MVFDLVIQGGTIATATDTFQTDVGVQDGKVAALGEGLQGSEIIDATGKLVLPGGVETHCHIAQENSNGQMTADDYKSGSTSAAFGGNTTIVPFAAQLKGQPIADVIRVYDERASVSVLDYGYHLIVTDTSVANFREDMLAAFARGITSFKVFLTYDIRLTDDQFLDVLDVAREAGALTMVHCENNAMIDRRRAACGRDGNLTPRWHAWSRPPEAEAEAIAAAGSKPSAAGPAPLIDDLRGWRASKAKAAGVPTHVICDDRLLQAIAEARPDSRAQLAALPGMRPGRLARWGEDLLGLVDGDGPIPATTPSPT